jgi:hypothetical protein
MKNYNNKFGNLAIIIENDAYTDYGKNILASYLYRKLDELWNVELLIISMENKLIPQTLKQCNSCLFNYSYDFIVKFDIDEKFSSLIKASKEYKNEIAKGMQLFDYLINNPNKYNAYVFIGLTYSILPLLSLTKKRNCIIPLLKPRIGTSMIANPSVQLALLNCDYYFCHSHKEANLLQSVQPYAEIRTFPIMLDINSKENASGNNMIADEDIALIMSEFIDSKIEHYCCKLKEKGYTPYILCEDKSNLNYNLPKAISFNDFIKYFNQFIDKIKIALFFMGEDFFPLLYNLAQYCIPIYISPDYPWYELIDMENIKILSCQENFSNLSEVKTIYFQEFHHHNYYNSYLLKFITEWSVDNKLRAANIHRY